MIQKTIVLRLMSFSMRKTKENIDNRIKTLTKNAIAK